MRCPQAVSAVPGCTASAGPALPSLNDLPAQCLRLSCTASGASATSPNLRRQGVEERAHSDHARLFRTDLVAVTSLVQKIQRMAFQLEGGEAAAEAKLGAIRS
jgi:hypothetical protein